MTHAGSTPDRPDPAALLAESSWLRRFARALVRDDASADDLVQDTFGAALARRQEEGAADEIRSPRAFLAGIARRIAAGGRRRAARRIAREEVHVRDDARERSAPAADEHAERIDTLQLVLAELRELPPAQQRTLSLHFLDGLDVTAIAAREGVAPATVRAHLARGLGALRERLDRRAGSRETWSLVLAPWALGPLTPAPAPAAPAPTPAPVLATAGALAVTAKWIAALAPIALLSAWLVQRADVEQPTPNSIVGPEAPNEAALASSEPEQSTPTEESRLAGRTAVASAQAHAEPSVANASHVEGRAVDALTGELVPELDLHIRSVDGVLRELRTGPDGSFRSSDAMEPGELVVEERDAVGSFTTRPREQRVEHPLAEDLAVRVGPTFRLLLDAPSELDPGGLIFQFRELSQRSERVPEATLRNRDDPWVRFGAEVTLLEGNGPFEIRAIDPSGLWVGSAEVTRTRGIEPAPIRVVLEERGTIEFRLAKSPNAAQAQIVLPVEGLDVEWVGRVILSFPNEEGTRTGRAKHLSPGRYAWTYGTGPGATGGTVEVVPGEVAVVELTSEDLGPTFDAEVSIDVTAVPDVDLEGWMVLVVSTDDPTTGFVASPERVPGKDPATDPDSWRIPLQGAPAGRWLVVPQDHPSGLWTPGKVTLRPGGGNAKMTLAEKPKEIAVTVRAVDDSTGEAIEGLELAHSSDGLTYGFTYASAGASSCSLHAPAELETEYLVRAPGYRVSQVLHVPARDGQEVVARLERGWSNRVVVYDAETFDRFPGVGVVVDGVEAGRTGVDGTLLLSGDGPPKSLSLLDDGDSLEVVTRPEELAGESDDPLLGWLFAVRSR